MGAWIAHAYFVIEYSIDSMSLLKSKLSLFKLAFILNLIRINVKMKSR